MRNGYTPNRVITAISRGVERIETELDNLYGDSPDPTVGRDTIKTLVKGMDYASIESFFTPQESEEIKKALGRKQLYVSSMSRESDPALHAHKLIETLRTRNSKGTDQFGNPIFDFSDANRINAVEIMTKHDGLPIQQLLRACKLYKAAPMVSFSITSLGSTAYEPGTLKPDDLMDRIEQLIAAGDLDPATTTIRIDPIVPGVTKKEDMKHIIDRCKAMGIKKFVSSIMQSYGYTVGTADSRGVIEGIDNAHIQTTGAPYD